jgi:hypothetical protein
VTISASAGNARLLLAGVSIATVLLYLRSLGNGWIYDDRLLLVDNREIGKWSYFWKAFVHDEIWFFDPSRLPQSSRYRPLSGSPGSFCPRATSQRNRGGASCARRHIRLPAREPGRSFIVPDRIVRNPAATAARDGRRDAVRDGARSLPAGSPARAGLLCEWRLQGTSHRRRTNRR